ncbi:MAG: hypothetical protein CVU00_02380 [Bacteroidetes bacterium HGW-Bacteroidetes-17]|jgi:branched-chain amino acid transport system ATP-binding protein|nr:MAG: hypothetical protein CVU00_02380 [Bacteroidetes bacterium HGW-Bacteroidetes-17]
MKEIITLSPGFSFSYSGRENYIIQIPKESEPMTIEYGKIYGIQGPNGSGKTTLLNVLNGFLRPTEGYITYYNTKTFNISKRSFKENVTVIKVANFLDGVRRLFQVPILADDISVLDSMLLVKRNKLDERFWNSFNPQKLILRLINRAKESDTEEAKALLKEFNFNDPSVSNSTLSYGQRRLITVLQMIFSDATLLLMDEPFANIHDDYVKKIKILLKLYIKGRNRSIVIIEHDNNNMKDFVDIIWTLIDTNITVKENG